MFKFLLALYTFQELKERCETIRRKRGRAGMVPLDCRTDLEEEMMDIRRDIVNFHGEMVLLENYSSLNYIGLVKILKKHDKRTGVHLRMPYINNIVLHQPFFMTELLSRLVHECEASLQLLFAVDLDTDIKEGMQLHYHQQGEHYGHSGDGVLMANLPFGVKADRVFSEDLLLDANSIYRITLGALRIMREIRRRSSTHNMFSLPPLNDHPSV